MKGIGEFVSVTAPKRILKGEKVELEQINLKKARLDILQAYYDVKTQIKEFGHTGSYTEGVGMGIRISLRYFGYTFEELRNMDYVSSELLRLKGGSYNSFDSQKERMLEEARKNERR